MWWIWVPSSAPGAGICRALQAFGTSKNSSLWSSGAHNSVWTENVGHRDPGLGSPLGFLNLNLRNVRCIAFIPPLNASSPRNTLLTSSSPYSVELCLRLLCIVQRRNPLQLRSYASPCRAENFLFQRRACRPRAPLHVLSTLR
ncbi:hypothetical protein B0H16DRAFT_1615944 [Mycena metata]|uniref:Uncharacterized protein n=1 Tax=Mycena metata TaxID=1033252 RepID=A0AAD7H9W0_9AGAR|nr:hypothetical protein B0H16DRAFT_1615944 [Mycena metata]